MSEIIRLEGVTQVLQLIGLPKPKHPMISVFRHIPEMVREYGEARFTGDMYFISLKDSITGSLGYGRSKYDFEEGMMSFIAPDQVVTPGSSPIVIDSNGWSILVHKDLITGHHLGSHMEDYSFFDYEVNEALHISDKEKNTLTELVNKIEEEIDQNMDKHSQKLIVSNLELLLDYCSRFYDRQFLTRTESNKSVTTQFNKELNQYFKESIQLELGLPSVGFFAEKLNMSPNYFGDLIKKETGRTAQDHIQSFVIDQAKKILLNSEDSISQVAYGLGFEYSQHFSRMFKSKTGMTPKEYRVQLN